MFMTVYVKFTSEDLYRKYQARFFDVFKNFGGRLPSAEEKSLVFDRE